MTVDVSSVLGDVWWHGFAAGYELPSAPDVVFGHGAVKAEFLDFVRDLYPDAWTEGGSTVEEALGVPQRNVAEPEEDETDESVVDHEADDSEADVVVADDVAMDDVVTDDSETDDVATDDSETDDGETDEDTVSDDPVIDDEMDDSETDDVVTDDVVTDDGETDDVVTDDVVTDDGETDDVVTDDVVTDDGDTDDSITPPPADDTSSDQPQPLTGIALSEFFFGPMTWGDFTRGGATFGGTPGSVVAVAVPGSVIFLDGSTLDPIASSMMTGSMMTGGAGTTQGMALAGVVPFSSSPSGEGSPAPAPGGFPTMSDPTFGLADDFLF